MRRKIGVLGCLMILLFLIGCSPKVETQMDAPSEVISTQDEIANEEPAKEFIKIGALNYTPPYISKVDDQFEGLFFDIVDEAFSRMDVAYEINDYSFPRLLEALKVGAIDIGVDIFKKPERLPYIYYSEDYPIASFPYNLFKLNTTDFEFSGDATELIPYQVGVIRGYSLGDYDVYLEDSRFTFEYTNDSDQNMEQLLKGRVDLVIDTLSTGQDTIEKKGIGDRIVVVEPPININYTYLGFSRTNHLESLIQSYEEAMESMIEDGTLEMLFKRYEIRIPDKLTH